MLSLTDIKNKYLKTTAPFCIYIINNQLFTGEIDSCLIDEKSIMQINVDKIKARDNSSPQIVDLDVIEILTNTKENIEKSKQIMIR